jgi:hypothetical protein
MGFNLDESGAFRKIRLGFRRSLSYDRFIGSAVKKN